MFDKREEKIVKTFDDIHSGILVVLIIDLQFFRNYQLCKMEFERRVTCECLG